MISSNKIIDVSSDVLSKPYEFKISAVLHVQSKASKLFIPFTNEGEPGITTVSDDCLNSIPNITPTISITPDQSISLILTSIALKELTLAHIINSEAKKIQFLVGILNTSVTPPTATLPGLLTLNNSVQQTLQTVVKQKILLQFKLENILDIVSITPLS